jgi:hypothetical protein
LLTVVVYGGVVAVPISVPFWKKSTLAMPSLSVAVAVMVKLAGARRTVPAVGLMRVTVGGVSTVRVTGAEVV